VMTENVVRVAPEEDQEAVAAVLAKYDLTALPVVDDRGVMLGVVTVDDVVDVVIEEATEDAQMMAAVVPLEDSYFETGFGTLVRKRAMWLSVLFVGTLLTANGKGMALAYTQLLGQGVLEFPMLKAYPEHSRDTGASHATPRVAILGHSRPEKGFELGPDLVERNPQPRFVVQVSPAAADAAWNGARLDLRTAANVELVRGPLETGAYHALMAAADIVLLPIITREVPVEGQEMIAGRIAFQELPRPHAEAGADLDALQLVLARRQGGIELVRLNQAKAPIQPHAGADLGRRLRRGNFPGLARTAGTNGERAGTPKLGAAERYADCRHA